MGNDGKIYYFFMKVGFGNSFLQHGEKLGGLWVGFDGNKIPEVHDNGLCHSNKSEKADLRYMAVASSEKWRDRVRIVAYGKDALTIWRPTGNLRQLAQDPCIDWGSKATYRKFDQSWHRMVREKLGGIGSDAFYQHHFGERGWKLLPASLEQVIPRESLFASIDSLAVWRNFLSNTFRPMFSLKGTALMQGLTWLDQVDDLPPMQISERETLLEQPLGKLVRAYLNQKTPGSEHGPLKNLSKKEKSSSALAILNPAQMETAAMHLCRDLGLTIDVGIGKGLDVVDVKATVRHLSPALQGERIRKVVSKLSQAGVRFTDRLKHNIETTKTLRIQCKARPGEEVSGTVLLMEPCSSGEGQDRLALDRIVESEHPFPELKEWMSLLEHDLSA